MKLRILFIILLALPAAAQQPLILNARLDTRSVAAGLEREFTALVNSLAGPAWIGYAFAVVPGRGQSCCYSAESCCRGCLLEGSDRASPRAPQAGPVRLEAPSHHVALFRVESRAVGKIRTVSQECELDAGGLPFYWLTGVNPAESVTLLAAQVSAAGPEDRERSRLREGAVAALAAHADPSADGALEKFLLTGQPASLRERAAFWLGSARGRRGYEILQRVVSEDSSDRLREKIVFALLVSRDPEAVNAILAVARSDKSARVRGQALFWLASKAGKKAAEAITEAIENDPELEVKKRAVFALSRLPADEGVPLLLQLARTNPNPAVRKQALFWLGQSKNPRALALFEEILLR